MIKTAHILKRPGTNRAAVEAYLPDNYSVVAEDEQSIQIGGQDVSGWTMEEYVLPRLFSGGHFATVSMC